MLSLDQTAMGGSATFGTALAEALRAHGVDVNVVRVADGSSRVDFLNLNDVALIQYDHGVFAGVDGDRVGDIIGALRVPSILIARGIPKSPTQHQYSALVSVIATVDHVVVMSEAAKQRLCAEYGVNSHKVATIPHGAIVPTEPPLKRPSRPTVLTWGLLGPGKGIERVITAMSSLCDLPGRPRYLVAGPTHPDALGDGGEAYRDARTEQVRRAGVSDSVVLDNRYFAGQMLTALIQSAAVVVLPYDSQDQVSSGALAAAIACGRPVVATAFPHAVELLSNGAGIVVKHDDPEAMVTALRTTLREPRLAGSMAAEARRLAPSIAWPAVAGGYLRLAGRLMAERRRVR
jgi:polysaccharide biosynthesis protein PslF